MTTSLTYISIDISLRLDESEEFLVTYKDPFTQKNYGLFVNELHYNGSKLVGVRGPSRNADGTRGFVYRSHQIPLTRLKGGILVNLESEIQSYQESTRNTFNSMSKHLNNAIIEKMAEERENSV